MKLGEKMLIGLQIGQKLNDIHKLGQKMTHSKNKENSMQHNTEETEKKYISPLERR